MGYRMAYLLFLSKKVEETLQGIQLHLELVSYFTCGPCGLYANIRGTVADQRFKGRTAVTGTYKGRQRIPQIHTPGYIISIDYEFWTLGLLIQKQIIV
jgi:hypothetical protein